MDRERYNKLLDAVLSTCNTALIGHLMSLGDDEKNTREFNALFHRVLYECVLKENLDAIKLLKANGIPFKKVEYRDMSKAFRQKYGWTTPDIFQTVGRTRNFEMVQYFYNLGIRDSFKQLIFIGFCHSIFNASLNVPHNRYRNIKVARKDRGDERDYEERMDIADEFYKKNEELIKFFASELPMSDKMFNTHLIKATSELLVWYDIFEDLLLEFEDKGFPFYRMPIDHGGVDYIKSPIAAKYHDVVLQIRKGKTDEWEQSLACKEDYDCISFLRRNFVNGFVTKDEKKAFRKKKWLSEKLAKS